MGNIVEKELVDESRNDVVSKTFWRTNEHFADLFNAVLFGGRQVVNPDCLEEMDTDVSGVIMSDDYKMSMNRYRDVVKKFFNGIELVVMGLEVQEHIHYGMPLRTMIYDALGYLKEFTAIKNWNKDNDNKPVNADEFLSGIKKEDRFHPIITIVFYYGETRWDGPLSLKDMMADMPAEFADMFVDYHINLVQILDSDKLLFHNDDVRILFDVVSSIYKRDFEHIFKEYKGNKISNELNWMIGKLTGRSNIPDIVEGKEGDVVDMCKAWEERDRQMEEKGFIAGSKATLIDDIMFMISYGFTKEILLKKYSESDYNEALSKMKLGN